MPIRNMFTKSFTHKRYTVASDSAGGWTRTLTTVSSDLRGVITGKSESIRVLGGDEQNILMGKFFCGVLEDVRIDDILTLGGQSWRVLSLKDPGQRGSHQECIIEEVMQVD